MEKKKRQRCVHVTPRQKKKLLELIPKHPELISCKVTQNFTYPDSQNFWQNIASECNAIPGAKKTWRQWRQTWRYIRSKAKKRRAKINREHSFLSDPFAVEQDLINDNRMSPTINYEEFPGFVSFHEFQPQVFNEPISLTLTPTVPTPVDHVPDLQPILPPTVKPSEELKTSSNSKSKKTKKRKAKKRNSRYFNNFNVSAIQEERKIKLKEDYINFKKDYLQQKLFLLKEQTETLKNLAQELSK